MTLNVFWGEKMGLIRNWSGWIFVFFDAIASLLLPDCPVNYHLKIMTSWHRTVRTQATSLEVSSGLPKCDLVVYMVLCVLGTNWTPIQTQKPYRTACMALPTLCDGWESMDMTLISNLGLLQVTAIIQGQVFERCCGSRQSPDLGLTLRLPTKEPQPLNTYYDGWDALQKSIPWAQKKAENMKI